MLQDSPAALKHEAVRYMMEKQKQLLRTSLRCIISAGIRLTIQHCVACSVMTSVNPDSQMICPVVGAPSVIFIPIHAGSIMTIGIYHPPNSKGRRIFLISRPGIHENKEQFFPDLLILPVG